jgi:hydrogenase-4 component F
VGAAFAALEEATGVAFRYAGTSASRFPQPIDPENPPGLPILVSYERVTDSAALRDGNRAHHEGALPLGGLAVGTPRQIRPDLTVVVGGALIFGAHTYKRMLAYSSVENMGLVAFAFGLGSPLALAGAYLHVLSHGVAKSLAFFSAGRIHHHLGTVEIGQARGLLRKSPAAARALLVGILALAGLPPLAPFTSKLMVLAAALPNVPWPYVLALLGGLALGFIGFMRQASLMMADPVPVPHGSAPPPHREPWTVLAALALLVAVNVGLAIAGPGLLRDLLAAAARGAGASP